MMQKSFFVKKIFMPDFPTAAPRCGEKSPVAAAPGAGRILDERHVSG